MSGARYRLVDVQGGKTHISSVILGEGEVLEHLSLEQSLHEASGWHVERMHWRTVFPELMCVKGTKARRIYVREFSPFDDCVTLEAPPPGARRDSPSAAPLAPSWLRETDDGFSIEDRL